MRRKLIQHGNSSLTLSLPIKWIKENNLSKGNEVEVDESLGKLIVSTKKHHLHKKIELDVTDSGKMIRKIIGACYKTGYDEVDIKYSSFEELKSIKEVVREQFTGFEIINQTKDIVKIKNITQTNFEEFKNVLRRFFLVLLQVSEETFQALEKKDNEWLKNITLLKIETDKFSDYLRRAINLGQINEYKRIAPLYIIIEQLEKVVDRYIEICSIISKEKITISKETIKVLNETSGFINSFYTMFYKFDIEKIIEFGKYKENIEVDLNLILIKASKHEIQIIILIERILNLVFDLNGPIMALYL